MKLSNAKRFAAIKARVEDLRERNDEAVKEGLFLRLASNVIPEMEWLVKEIERLSEGDAAEITEEATV